MQLLRISARGEKEEMHLKFKKLMLKECCNLFFYTFAPVILLFNV